MCAWVLTIQSLAVRLDGNRLTDVSGSAFATLFTEHWNFDAVRCVAFLTAMFVVVCDSSCAKICVFCFRLYYTSGFFFLFVWVSSFALSRTVCLS